MRITLDLTKTIDQNASFYFEQAKIARKKAERAKIALEESKKKLLEIEENINKEIKEQEIGKTNLKKEWFEKFRWFFTSDGFLVIGGRDAGTNELVIKKYTEKDDLVFHTEMAGSPFIVLKTQGKKPSNYALEETAIFTAVFSKAWKLGRTTTEVFYVLPEQVTKETKAGEFITRGSFMIYGKKNFLKPVLKIFIGIMNENIDEKYKGKIMIAPENSIKKNCDIFLEILQGNEKNSDIAKKIKQKLNYFNVDDILRLLPNGSKLGKN
ncbi:MAG: NFACT RNA binding domain-containing protein [Candidatus Woesearchaeota archaeon]